VKADQLQDLLSSWQEALRVARAIDSRAYQQARGWDLSGWTYRREPWGMYFVRHDRRQMPAEVVAVVTAAEFDAEELEQAVPGCRLTTRLVDLSSPVGNGTSNAKAEGPPNGSRAKQKSVRIRVGILCLGFVGLAIATTLTRSRRDEPPPLTSEAQRYLYCPECGLEMTCPPEYAGRVTFCPHCGISKKMEVNSFSHGAGEAPRSPPNRALLAVAFGVPVALAAAVYATGRLRAAREHTPEGDGRRLACPGCGHKMTAKVFSPGSTAVCPACAEQFVVPGPGRHKETAGDASVQKWGDWLGTELTKKGRR
jgi:transcription elongation factor Elf1